MQKIFLAISFLLLFSGCDEDYLQQTDKLAKFAKNNPIGSSEDYWLVKTGSGYDDKVALIFGYMSDAEGCEDIANSLNEKYPSNGYVCRVANIAK